MTSTASGRLRLKLEIAYPTLRASAERIWCNPRLVELYPEYLCTVHTIVRSAVPLLEAAAQRARELAPEDGVAAALAGYLARHADEERGHDGWLLEDLEACGGDPRDALLRIPSPSVATLVGAQYYWLHHFHPVALLGHMAVVEGYSPQPGFAERLRGLTGYPRDAFRALSRHERLDVRHKRELYATIDALDLAPRHERMLAVSALHTVTAIAAVLDEVSAGVPAVAAGAPT